MSLRLLFAVLCFFTGTAVHAQPHPNLTNAYRHTYYYRISNEQALKLCKEKSPDSSWFHTLAYVQQTDSLNLPPGNYLQVDMNTGGITYKYIPVTSWNIFTPGNGSDLVVQLTDKHNLQACNLPEISIGGRRVPYDAVTQCYILRGFKKTGLLTVKDTSGTFYYPLTLDETSRRPYYNSRLYQGPLSYLLTLLQLYDQGLYDAYGSLKAKAPYGSLSRLVQQKRKLFRSRKYRQWEKRPYSSYFFFSKPKYREGDTIQFKAHLLHNVKETWYHKPLSVFIGERDEAEDALYLGKVQCPRKGAGYSFRFTITDSMDIDLDDSYYIYLKDADSNVIGSGSFVYENYELKKAVFNIAIPEDATQVKGKPFYIHFTAKDENDLPMPDTRATVTLTPYSVTNVKPDQAFIPDTLWRYTLRISKGTDSLLIPDSVFPDADLRYQLNVSMLNSENERIERNPRIEYNRQPANLVMTLLADKIKIDQREQRSGKVNVYAEDRFGFRIVDTLVRTPCLLPLQTAAEVYYSATEDDDASLYMNREPDLVSYTGYRTEDSCFLSIENPRQIPVVYHLYKNKKEIRRGSWQDLPFGIPSSENALYYLVLEYVWAGKIERRENTPILFKGKATLHITEPPVITPGQEAEIQVQATDYRNRPIAGLNVLAYSYTAKFDEDKDDNYDENVPETIPALGFKYKARKAHTLFAFSDLYHSKKQALNYPFWNKKMMLDTNWAYRFSYPAAGTPELTEVAITDSVTQVAPFVMENGMPQSIHYVYIDKVPVYFGFTDHSAAYSFAVDTNYHEFEIRTSKKLITLDSIKVKTGFKTLFSIDQAKKSNRFTCSNMPDSFTTYERYRLFPYIMQVEMAPKMLQYAFIESGLNNISLGSTGQHPGDRIVNETVGPVVGSNWLFHSFQRFDRRFQYEAGYTYTFSADLVKMKTIVPASLPAQIPRNRVPNIQDEVLSRDKMINSFEQQLLQVRKTTSLNRLNQKLTGKAGLFFEFAAAQKSEPVNVLLGRPGDFNFLNIYSGDTRNISNIPAGKYELFFVDALNCYRRTGIIEVKDQGYNFYRITHTDTLKGDAVATINTLLNNLYNSKEDEETVNLNLLVGAYAKATYGGKATTFRGVVFDEQGEGIPGVSVSVEGTQIGTITGIEGDFEVYIPENGSQTLIIRALGYGETKIKAHKNMKIIMSQSVNVLTEVTIEMPYSTGVTKEKYVGAADVITSKVLNKVLVSEFAKSLESAAPGLLVAAGTQPGNASRIRIGNTGESMPLIVINGVPYNGAYTELDISLIAAINFSKEETIKKLYGSPAANGVIFITIKEDAILPDALRAVLQQAATPTPEEELMVSSLRRNFRDDAYWQPDLVTDKNGKVSFKVKFPDDITRWKTIVTATDNKKHTGIAFGDIKSYKPVAASLYSPRFLLDGDTALLIGKSVNYLPDSLNVSTTFYHDSLLIQSSAIKLGQFYNDTLVVTVSGTDSLRLKFLLAKADGYFDGEERSIPVHRTGTRVARGSFLALDSKDTSFSITPGKDSLHLVIMASLTDVLDKEIEIVRDYGYLCNEQMASKVLAFINKEQIDKALGRPFKLKDRNYVQRLLNKLVQNQNNDNLWGWWSNSNTVPWITTHVMNVLFAAKQAGYGVYFKNNKWQQAYIFQLENDTTTAVIPALNLLSKSGLKLDFERYIRHIESIKNISLSDYLELVLLRRQLGLPYNTDRLINTQQTDAFGNIYWQDTASNVYNNEVLTTVTAFNILQGETSSTINAQKIANWLLQQRQSQGWRNTYESALIINALSQHLPINNQVPLKPQLQFSGGWNKTVDTFPLQLSLAPQTEPIRVHKTGSLPVYCSWYYNTRDTSKNASGNNFKLHTQFEQHDKVIDYLPAGTPVTLKVNVEALRSAAYVMVEIPIPAGCSYQDKQQSDHNHEIHREYFDDHVAIFCEQLPKGKYEFTVTLLPRYAGHYTLNPAKAELMYFPVFYGKEGLKQIRIQH